MANYHVGQHAESRAAQFLTSQGFEILNQNWKTRYCEIDIIAKKRNIIYFVEVKYRRTTNQGHGTDYITSKKLKQMQFAAEMWMHDHNWRGACELAVVSIDGAAISFIDMI